MDEESSEDANTYELQAAFTSGRGCIFFGREYAFDVNAFGDVWEASDEGIISERQGRHRQ